MDAPGAKRRKYILNDRRIKACLRRFDNNVNIRLDFLKVVSHSVSMGAHISDVYRLHCMLLHVAYNIIILYDVSRSIHGGPAFSTSAKLVP